MLLLALLPFVGWAQQNYYGQHVSIKLATGDSIQYDLKLSNGGFKPIVKDGKVQWYFQGIPRICPNDDYWSYNEHFSLEDVERIDFRSFEYDETEARKALVEFYHVMDGDKWEHKENWCSDKPIWEWFGINGNTSGNGSGRKYPWVEEIWFSCVVDNIPTLHTLPDCISKMGPIKTIGFNAGIGGELPEFLGNIYSLHTLNFDRCSLTGTIPVSIAKLPHLFTFGIPENQYSGPLPEEFILTCLEKKNIPGNNFYLNHNNFSGSVPKSIQQHRRFADTWPSIIVQNNPLDLQDLLIPAPIFKAKDINGNYIDLAETYKKHKYTLLYMWGSSSHYTSSQVFNQSLIPAYEAYKDKGMEVIGIHYDNPFGDLLSSGYLNSHEIPWNNIMRKDWEDWEQVGEASGLFARGGCPGVFLVDQNGIIVFNNMIDENGVAYDDDLDKKMERSYELFTFLEEKLGKIDTELYTSTDYSHDGEVTTLQTASKGQGIDLVFVGEGFTDKDIADGGFDKSMNDALEQFFAYEPYTSLRDRFNVYAVKTVSPNAEFVDGCKHAIDLDVSKALDYATKVTNLIPDRPMYVSVIYNKTNGERSFCVMLEDNSYICFAMDGANNVFNHEAGGHGIGKLFDEYVETAKEGDWTHMPDEAKIELDNLWTTLGWGANVDWRSNPTEVKWTKFINDTRYADEKIGVYEGSYLYWYGAYRPTENSMMRYNDMPFNAPSREAIYKRVMQESEGDGWTYDYETFVSFDAAGHSQFVNALNTYTARQKTAPKIERQQLTAPPVFLKGTWQDELKKNNK